MMHISNNLVCGMDMDGCVCATFMCWTLVKIEDPLVSGPVAVHGQNPTFCNQT